MTERFRPKGRGSSEAAFGSGFDGATMRESSTISRRSRRVLTLLLTVGFLALTGAVVTATNASPTGYELSLYTATPVAYWVLTGVAFVVALGVALFAPRDALFRGALLLGGAAAFTVPSLPVLRGYQFYGKGDALFHLGFARLIASGGMEWTGLLYPGSHTLGIFIRELSGTPMTRSLMYVVPVFLLVYVLFVPLTVGTLIPDRRAVFVATLSALLFLPLNEVSTHLTYHPFSLAVLFSPLVYYLCFKHLLRQAEDDSLGPLAATSLVLPLTSIGIVLFHPQAAIDLLIIVATFSFVHLAVRWRYSNHSLANWRGLSGQVVLLAAFAFHWSSQHDETGRTLEKVSETFWALVYGTAQAGSEVQETGDSAASIGGSIYELFAKLFLIDFVYVLLGGVIVFWLFVAPYVGLRSRSVGGQLEDSKIATMLLVTGGIVSVPYYLLEFFGTVSHHFFRHLGFAMVIVTIAGSFALFYVFDWAVRTDREALFKTALAVFLLAGVVLSFAAIHHSPYMYNNNAQKTDATMNGFVGAFAHQPSDGEVEYAHTRLSIRRHEWAVGGMPGTPWYPGRPANVSGGIAVPEAALTSNVTEYFMTRPFSGHRQDTYLAVTEAKRQKHTVAFSELYYADGTLKRIEKHENVHRIRSTGEFTLYYVDLPPAAGKKYRAGEELNASSTDSSSNSMIRPSETHVHG